MNMIRRRPKAARWKPSPRSCRRRRRTPMSDGTVVLTGAYGILGSAFVRVLPADRLVSLDQNDLDPADPTAVLRSVVQLKPSLLINCAADTDVEGAETAPQRAFATN